MTKAHAVALLKDTVKFKENVRCLDSESCVVVTSNSSYK